MNNREYVFSQLLDFLDRNHFNYLVRKYEGDKYVKQFTCYNQLAVLMFGQLSSRESLRDVVLATQAHAAFEEFAYRMVAEAQKCRAIEIFKLKGKVYAFDSTTVDLCLNVFQWALFRRKKGGVKIHTLYDIETQIPTFFHITPANYSIALDIFAY